jgi:hypothetical protein
MLRNLLYLGLQQMIIITPMHIKQEPTEMVTRSPSSYFIILFGLVLLFSLLSIATILLYNPQIATAQHFEHKETKSNFLTYENPIHKIKIQYPVGWKKIESQGFEVNSDRHVVEFKLLSESHLQKEDLAALHIYIHNLPSPSLLDQFARFFDRSSQKTDLEGFVLSHFTSILKRKLPNFDFIKSESDATTTLAGNPAHKIVYKYKKGQNDIKVMETLTVKYNKGYILMYNAEASKYSEYLPTIQKMMDSFEIK